MDWLTPLTGLYAALAAVPTLLLLYFLRLKRREQPVSSTFFWRRAVRDLEANAPFQRLRRNLLLLLQLLALVLVLLALAGPVLSLTSGPGRRYVLLIDRSASMNTREGDATRLDLARAEAHAFVDTLRGGGLLRGDGGGDLAMVIAFADHASVACTFTGNKAQLHAAIDAIEPTSGGSRLGEALTLARAFSQPGGGEDNDAAAPEASLLLFSDGRIHDRDQVVVGEDEITFHRIGAATSNIGVVAMQARRRAENPEEVQVFAALANYDTAPATTDVELTVNGDIRAVRSVTLPGAQRGEGVDELTPGRASAAFTVMQAGAGVIRVAQLRGDALADDDAAWALVEAPHAVRVLLVTPGNAVLAAALRACGVERLAVMDGSAFDALDANLLSMEQPYDLIVLDRHQPERLPRSSYLILGPPPAALGLAVGEVVENQFIVDWRSQHPLLQHVNLAGLFAAQCQSVTVPADAERLADFTDAAAMILLRRHDRPILLAPFDLLASNWPFDPGLVMFCHNAVEFLAASGSVGDDNPVGAPIIVEGFAAGAEVTVTRPDGAAEVVAADGAGIVRLGRTDQVGVYSFTQGDRSAAAVVNLLGVEESNIAPAGDLRLSGAAIAAEPAGPGRANVPLWPLLVLAALALAYVEWFAYTSRLRI